MKLGLLFFMLTGTVMANIHQDFVSLEELCPGIKIEASYSKSENFTGSIVAGYRKAKAYIHKKPGVALCEVHAMAQEKGLGLKIFDAYRPVKAVQFFQDWALKTEDNLRLKEIFYPNFSRLELFEKGFIAKQSSHSRGSAVDLTLFDLRSGRDLDMGSGFDYFDEISHTESSLITPKQLENRLLLKSLMEEKGFKNFAQEWWHYSFRPEPFPDTYFDFDVE
jgi:D-alanyl-D-alanine dipeptidase